MISEQSILALITARGGSKGVPGKNVRSLCGIPLIGWTIQAALKSRYIDRLILSSDDSEIIKTAIEYGCEVPFVRDFRLAQDFTPSIDVVLDAIEKCPGFEWVLLLQPTSPLRSTEDIDNAIELCLKSSAESCVSVHQSTESPYWMFSPTEDNHLIPLHPEINVMRRQDLPITFMLNGAIYFARCEWLKKTKSFFSHETVAYNMPVERSIDVDTELDFKWLNFILDNQ